MSVSTTVQAQPPTPNDALITGDGDHPTMDLLDDLGAKRDDEPAEGLGIENLLHSHPS